MKEFVFFAILIFIPSLFMPSASSSTTGVTSSNNHEAHPSNNPLAPPQETTPSFVLSTDSLEERTGLPNLEEILAGMASQSSPFGFALPSFSNLPSLFSSPPLTAASSLMRLGSRQPIMVQIPPQVLEEFNANGIVMPLHKCKYCNDGRNRNYHTQGMNSNNRPRSPGRFFQRGNQAAFHENQAAYRAQQRLPGKGGKGGRYIEQQQIQQQPIQQQQIQQQRETNYGKGSGGNNGYQGGFRPMNIQGKGGQQPVQQQRLNGHDSKKIVVVVLHLNKDNKLVMGGQNSGYGGGYGGGKGNPYARIDQQPIEQQRVMPYAAPPATSSSTDSVYFDTSLFTPDNFFTMRDLANSAMFGGAPGITTSRNNNNNPNSNVINSNNDTPLVPKTTTTTNRPFRSDSSSSSGTNVHSMPFNTDSEIITQEKEDEASYRASSASLPNTSSSGHHVFSS